MMARLAAAFGTAIIQSARSEIQSPKTNGPMGTRPSITTTAVKSNNVAITLRARKARKAAEAMKKAKRANIVACTGVKT